MQVNNLMGLLGAIVTVALVTTIVTNDQSKEVIKAIGSSFSNALLAAQGKTV